MKLLDIEQMSQNELIMQSIGYFDEIAARIPDCLININPKGKSPNWGHAWYEKGKNGLYSLFRENWDTSG